MPMTRVEPYRPPGPTIRELMEGRPAGEDDGGVPPKGYLGRPPKGPEAGESERDTAMARGRPAESTRSRRTTVRGWAGDRGEGRVERGERRLTSSNGLKDWDAREGHPPGMAGDRQGPRHRMAWGLDKRTEGSRDRWPVQCCYACMQGGGNHTAESTAIKKKKHEQNPTAPQGACGTRRAGGGGTGRSKRTDKRPCVAPKKRKGKKNKSNKEQ